MRDLHVFFDASEMRGVQMLFPDLPTQTARADNARLVLDVWSHYDEATWGLARLKNRPEVQSLVRQCQAVLPS